MIVLVIVIGFVVAGVADPGMFAFRGVLYPDGDVGIHLKPRGAVAAPASFRTVRTRTITRTRTMVGGPYPDGDVGIHLKRVRPQHRGSGVVLVIVLVFVIGFVVAGIADPGMFASEAFSIPTGTSGSTSRREEAVAALTSVSNRENENDYENENDGRCHPDGTSGATEGQAARAPASCRYQGD